MIRAGIVAEWDVVEAMAACLILPVVNVEEYPALPVLEERVAVKFIKQAKALPLYEDDEHLVLAMVDPLDDYILNAFRLVTHRKVTARLAVPSELEAAFERLYSTGKSSMDQIVGEVETREDGSVSEDLQRLKELASEAPIIRLVSLIISNDLAPGLRIP